MENDMPNVNIRISVQSLPSPQGPIATVLMITCSNKYLRAIRHILTTRSPHLFGMYTCIISKNWTEFFSESDYKKQLKDHNNFVNTTNAIEICYVIPEALRATYHPNGGTDSVIKYCKDNFICTFEETMESKDKGRFMALVDKHRHQEKMALLYDVLVTNYNSIGNGIFSQQSIDSYGTTPRIGNPYYEKALSEAVKSNIQVNDDYYKAATKGTNQAYEDNE